MVELKVGDRLILNDSDWKVNVFEVKVVSGIEGKSFTVVLEQVKGRM